MKALIELPVVQPIAPIIQKVPAGKGANWVEIVGFD